MLPSDVKDLPDQLQEEEVRSPELAQVVDLLMSISQVDNSADLQVFGAGNPPSPMYGEEESDEDLLDIEFLVLCIFGYFWFFRTLLRCLVVCLL